MRRFISIGCTVSAKVGPLVDKETAADDATLDGRTKRVCRTRERWTGTVIALAMNQHWMVFWPTIGHCAAHAPSKLRLEDDSTRSALSSINVDSILKDCNLGNK